MIFCVCAKRLTTRGRNFHSSGFVKVTRGSDYRSHFNDTHTQGRIENEALNLHVKQRFLE